MIDVAPHLHAIQRQWVDAIPPAIDAIVATTAGQTFYAASFWLLYADYTTLGVPSFALNVESNVTVHDGGGQYEPWSTRWAPADWRWPVLRPACDALAPAYLALSKSLAGASRAVWDDAIRSHEAMICRTSRVLTALMRSRIGPGGPLAPTFVVATIDDQREPDDRDALVRASIEPGLLRQLEGILQRA